MDHGGKRPYPCPECSFTCKTKQQLNEHRRKHSVNHERKKLFIYINLFWQVEKAYSCALCGTRFTYRNGLIKHTKLNRCPKRPKTPDSEKYNKTKNKDFGFAIYKEVNLKFPLYSTWGSVGTGAWTWQLSEHSLFCPIPFFGYKFYIHPCLSSFVWIWTKSTPMHGC